MTQDNSFLQHALQCINEKDLAKAEEILSQALESSPGNPDIWRFLSVVAALKADYGSALELINQAISLAPENGVAHSNKGNILKELGRFEEALSSFDEAILLAPNYSEGYNNKGNALQDLHLHEESLVWYDKALALNPEYVEAYFNKGNALEWLHRHQEAMTNFHKATTIDSQYVNAYWQKGLSQLADGNFELGWQNYEARWTKANPIQFQHSEIPRLEEINNLSGKKILIWAEQGLGDTIQFCRYIKLLSQTGAKITFLIPDQLLNLLKPLRQFCELKSSLTYQAQDFDFQSPLLSLPLLFGTTLKSIPCEIPYLGIDEEIERRLESTVPPSPNLKVGIIWSGGFRLLHSQEYLAGHRRNIEFDQIASLKEVQGVDFYSLQKGDPAESELLLRKDEFWPHLINCAPLLNDFADTAALVGAMDLIISVDTSTAHLAGALGKPVWILNRYDSCWRWLRGQSDSPWYPTATIYQQGSPGDWGGVIEKVKIDLSLLAKANLQKKDVY